MSFGGTNWSDVNEIWLNIYNDKLLSKISSLKWNIFHSRSQLMSTMNIQDLRQNCTNFLWNFIQFLLLISKINVFFSHWVYNARCGYKFKIVRRTDSLKYNNVNSEKLLTCRRQHQLCSSLYLHFLENLSIYERKNGISFHFLSEFQWIATFAHAKWNCMPNLLQFQRNSYDFDLASRHFVSHSWKSIKIQSQIYLYLHNWRLAVGEMQK